MIVRMMMIAVTLPATLLVMRAVTMIVPMTSKMTLPPILQTKEMIVLKTMMAHPHPHLLPQLQPLLLLRHPPPLVLQPFLHPSPLH
jgi:hypothetical protein